MTELCVHPVDRVWLPPDYKKRSEVIGTALCGHPQAEHQYGLCLACDNLDRYAGMFHKFLPGGNRDGTG